MIGKGAGGDFSTTIITLNVTDVSVEGEKVEDLAVRVNGIVYEPRLTFPPTDIPMRSE
jgi:hypothetical protein